MRPLILILLLTGCSTFQKEPAPVVDVDLIIESTRNAMCPIPEMFPNINSGTQEDFVSLVEDTGMVGAEDFRLFWGRSEFSLEEANQMIRDIKAYYVARGCEL